MSVTVPDDYVGKHELAISTGNNLQSYIDRYERIYLIRLFGCELFESYEADPNTPRFTDLNDPFCTTVNNQCKEVYNSMGLKDMLLGFVYFHYSQDVKRKATVSGIIVDDNENSRETTSTEADPESRFNESVETFNALQNKMKTDTATYPEFYGQNLRFSFFGGAW